MKQKEIIIAKGLSFPLNIPFSISKNNDSIIINSSGFKFPLTLPFSLSQKVEEPPTGESNGFTFPLSLPFSLSPTVEEPPTDNVSGGLVFPLTLPFTMSAVKEEEGRRKITKKYNITEEAWVFQGIVFDENVVSLMRAQVLLLEEVKGRILVDLSLVDKNHLKLKWYGSEVETVQVFKKLDIDDKYEPDGEPIPWEEGSTIITVSDSSYNIILKGPKGSGESGVVDLSDTNAHKIINDLRIALNEKTYFLTANFKETYNLDINF